MLASAQPTLAVTISVPTTFAAADASDLSVDGVFTVPGDLILARGGNITCNDPALAADASACNTTIVVLILIRAAVAGVLNAAHPDVNYPRTVADIQSAVNAAIASGDKTTVTNLATAIDNDNNRHCPLN